MLILLTGPTGSGKTSLALLAARRHQWRVIPTFSTREPRVGQLETKRHVCRSQMTMMLSGPHHFRSFRYEGHQYATPLDEVKGAARDPLGVAIMDWVHPHPEDLS